MAKEVIYRRIGAAVLILCGLGLNVSAHAQSTFGSIVGVVHDTTQAVVSGASVKVRRLEDNSLRSTTSDERFHPRNWPPGRR